LHTVIAARVAATVATDAAKNTTTNGLIIRHPATILAIAVETSKDRAAMLVVRFSADSKAFGAIVATHHRSAALRLDVTISAATAGVNQAVESKVVTQVAAHVA
jgi:hypothetical protein